MLHELRVENLGIIADLLLPLGPGMTVITGETGAGKTLIVDALDLLCGGRADASLVREGAAEARVEGRFVFGDEEVVLARVVPASGRTRGYIDNHLATAAELGARGRDLVDLHGQHAHQSLLHPSEQRAMLDRFAGEPAATARNALADAHANRRQVEAALAELGGDDRSRARQLDLLRYELEEIDTAAIDDADEEAKLAAEEEILADAEAHRAALEAAHEQLEGGAQDALGAAIAALAGREPFAPIADRVRALQIETAELDHDVRTAAEGIVADPQRLADVQHRRARLRDLVRKYGPTLADVQKYSIEARERLEQLEGYDARAARIEAELAESAEAVALAAQALSDARRAAAGPLAAAVQVNLRTLALPNAHFEIAVDPGDAAAAGEDGADEVTFLLAPNPGEPARPLARAASGGELARAMLALRVVLTAAPPTLVFDEVDAGIGGEAGTAVGRALARLGGQHQVLCVTHLPQVAAFADAQVAVAKGEVDRRTVAHAELLLDDARVGELSRMLAGVGDSAHARRHAEELLATSRDAVNRRTGQGGAVKLFRRRPKRSVEIHATARVDRRTKDLVRRLNAGDIAIIDHADIDRVAADTLVASGVSAVVNASPSITGRYPNGGPIRIVQAGIPLIDAVGADVMDEIREGEPIELRDGALWRDGVKIAVGEVLVESEIETRMEEARRTIGTELQTFARNTLDYIETEAQITFEPLELPRLKVTVKGRHALVVVRGHDYEHDLKALRPYIREYQPVLIAVDGGADALLAVKFKPDIIIGDFDSLSDEAMHCGAQLIHHVHPDGRAPGREELRNAGVVYTEFVAEGMSEDAAMLLAYEAGATLIVAVGTHATMVEFLDKGRKGMASTFLTRLRLGPVLVDAKGVSRLYEGRIRRRDMVFLVAAAIAAMLAMTWASHSLHVFLDGFRLTFSDTWSRITSWF